MAWRHRWPAALVLAVALAGCAGTGDDAGLSPPLSGGTASPVATEPETTGSSTIPPSTTHPSTDAVTEPATDPTVPTTTTPTTASTTSTTVPGSGRQAVPHVLDPPADPHAWVVADLPAGAGVPCCAEGWRIGTSPELPEPTASLADGVYPFEFVSWMPDWEYAEYPNPAVLRVRRFLSCADSVDNGGDVFLLSCEPPREADAVAIDRRYAIEQPLDVDEDVVVGYTGPGSCEGSGGASQWVTTGAGYADLVNEMYADYNEWMGPMVNAPASWGITDAMIEEHLAEPGSPFAVRPCEDMGGTYTVWNGSQGVPVLMQTYRSWETGWALQPWELTFPATMHVEDGRVMLLVASHYRS